MTTPPPLPTGYGITERQLNVLSLIAAGRGPDEVARALGLGRYAVKGDLRLLHRNFRARTRAHLITQAFRYGWLRIVDDPSRGPTLVAAPPAGAQLLPASPLSKAAGTRPASTR